MMAAFIYCFIFVVLLTWCVSAQLNTPIVSSSNLNYNPCIWSAELGMNNTNGVSGATGDYYAPARMPYDAKLGLVKIYCNMGMEGGFDNVPKSGWLMVANQANSGNFMDAVLNFNPSASFGSEGFYDPTVSFYRPFAGVPFDYFAFVSGDGQLYCIMSKSYLMSASGNANANIQIFGSNTIGAGGVGNVKWGNTATGPVVTCNADATQVLWAENNSSTNIAAKNNHGGIQLFVGSLLVSPPGQSYSYPGSCHNLPPLSGGTELLVYCPYSHEPGNAPAYLTSAIPYGCTANVTCPNGDAPLTSPIFCTMTSGANYGLPSVYGAYPEVPTWSESALPTCTPYSGPTVNNPVNLPTIPPYTAPTINCSVSTAIVCAAGDLACLPTSCYEAVMNGWENSLGVAYATGTYELAVLDPSNNRIGSETVNCTMPNLLSASTISSSNDLSASSKLSDGSVSSVYTVGPNSAGNTFFTFDLGSDFILHSMKVVFDPNAEQYGIVQLSVSFGDNSPASGAANAVLFNIPSFVAEQNSIQDVVNARGRYGTVTAILPQGQTPVTISYAEIILYGYNAPTCGVVSTKADYTSSIVSQGMNTQKVQSQLSAQQAIVDLAAQTLNNFENGIVSAADALRDVGSAGISCLTHISCDWCCQVHLFGACEFAIPCHCSDDCASVAEGDLQQAFNDAKTAFNDLVVQWKNIWTQTGELAWNQAVAPIKYTVSQVQNAAVTFSDDVQTAARQAASAVESVMKLIASEALQEIIQIAMELWPTVGEPIMQQMEPLFAGAAKLTYEAIDEAQSEIVNLVIAGMDDAFSSFGSLSAKSKHISSTKKTASTGRTSHRSMTSQRQSDSHSQHIKAKSKPKSFNDFSPSFDYLVNHAKSAVPPKSFDSFSSSMPSASASASASDASQSFTDTFSSVSALKLSDSQQRKIHQLVKKLQEKESVKQMADNFAANGRNSEEIIAAMNVLKGSLNEHVRQSKNLNSYSATELIEHLSSKGKKHSLHTNAKNDGVKLSTHERFVSSLPAILKPIFRQTNIVDTFTNFVRSNIADHVVNLLGAAFKWKQLRSFNNKCYNSVKDKVSDWWSKSQASAEEKEPLLDGEASDEVSDVQASEAAEAASLEAPEEAAELASEAAMDAGDEGGIEIAYAVTAGVGLVEVALGGIVAGFDCGWRNSTCMTDSYYTYEKSAIFNLAYSIVMVPISLAINLIVSALSEAISAVGALASEITFGISDVLAGAISLGVMLLAALGQVYAQHVIYDEFYLDAPAASVPLWPIFIPFLSGTVKAWGGTPILNPLAEYNYPYGEY